MYLSSDVASITINDCELSNIGATDAVLFQAQTYLADLVSSCDRCQIINIGQSFEGRDLNVVKVKIEM